jgi:hypothetical protein
MKLYLFFISTILLISAESKSQNYTKSKLGVGLNYITLDLPDDITFFPKINYQHQFHRRLFGTIELGYLHYNGRENTFNILPEVRQRITLDLSGKIAIAKYKNNYLKIEGGSSIWYRNDKLINQIKFIAEPPDYVPQITSYKENNLSDWNVGYHLGGELDISLGMRFSMVGHVRIIQFKRVGTSSLLGIAVYYKLK